VKVVRALHIGAGGVIPPTKIGTSTSGQIDMQTIEHLAHSMEHQYTQEANKTGGQIRCGKVWNTGCRAWVRAPTFSHGVHGDLGTLRLAAQHPQCPPELLEQLATHQSSNVRCAVARHPHCPHSLLERFAMSERHMSVATEALLHPALSPEIYQAATKRLDAAAIYHLANRPECSTELLRVMAASVWGGYRNRIAQHPNCPMDLLRQWVRAPLASGITTAVARNPQCPPDILIELLRHPVDNTSQAAATHPNLPEEYRTLMQVSS